MWRSNTNFLTRGHRSPSATRMSNFGMTSTRSFRAHLQSAGSAIWRCAGILKERVGTSPTKKSSNRSAMFATRAGAYCANLSLSESANLQKSASAEERAIQANGLFMPALSGDEGDATTGDPTTWLTVTALQYRRLEAWAHDRFSPGPRHPAVASSVADQPWRLTHAVLDSCTGGAFYPGIEMTAISRSPRAYSEAYRLADNLVAGDITKYMAVPWQADFFECNTHWWPAQRPDSVITAKSVEELDSVFSYERKQGELDRLMLVRQPWARGVETARPDPSKIESLLFPPPNPPDGSPHTSTDYPKS